MARLRFGQITFDQDRRLVSRGWGQLHLPPKAYQLLELLLSRRPNAVSKAEIQETLWPNVTVTEASLATVVKELRRAVGDSAREPSIVRTVFGFGYALDAVVRELPPLAPAEHRHVLRWGSGELLLAEGDNVIGRDADAAVWIDHPSVSREHAVLRVTGATVTIADLGSKNGTWCAGRPVTDPVVVADGDEIRVGSVTIAYRGTQAPGSTETAL